MRKKTNVLRKRMLFIIIFVLVVELLLCALVYFLKPDRFQATVTMRVGSSGGAISNEGYDLNSKLLEDYRYICYSDTVLEKTINATGLSFSIDALRHRTVVQALSSTNLMTITVWTGSSETCAQLANAMADSLSQEVNNAYKLDNISIVDVARPPKSPERLQTALILLVGFLLSLIVACIVVLVLDYFDDTIRSTEQAATLFGRPVLGQIPHGVTRLRKR